jgi:hypothetical protein
LPYPGAAIALPANTSTNIAAASIFFFIYIDLQFYCEHHGLMSYDA